MHAYTQPSDPIKVILAPIIRNESSPLAKIKSQYGDAILNLHFAQNKGFDDALSVNSKGHVTCLTHSNVFFFIDNSIHTPPLSDGIIDGITRKLIFKICKTEGISVLEKSMTVSTVEKATCAFSTNSLQGLRLWSHFMTKKLEKSPQIESLLLILNYSRKL